MEQTDRNLNEERPVLQEQREQVFQTNGQQKEKGREWEAGDKMRKEEKHDHYEREEFWTEPTTMWDIFEETLSSKTCKEYSSSQRTQSIQSLQQYSGLNISLELYVLLIDLPCELNKI